MTNIKVTFRKKWWVKVSLKKDVSRIEFELHKSLQKWSSVNLKNIEDNFDKKINDLITENK